MSTPYQINLRNPEDSPQKIADKLNTLHSALDATVIKDSITRTEFDKLSKKFTGYVEGNKERLNMNDLRWHGSGATKVEHDSTLTGLGTTTSPLSVTTPSSGGTVSSVSVVTANGLSGMVASATTTPAITLTIDSTYPTLTSVSTLTNKRITPRIQYVTDSTTINPDSDNYDIISQINTQSTNTTINTPSGTPFDGQSLLFRINLAHTLTLNFSTGYKFPDGTAGFGLPSVNGTVVIIQFYYDSNISKWELACSSNLLGYA